MQPCQSCNSLAFGSPDSRDRCKNCCSPEIVAKLKSMLEPHPAPEKENIGCLGEPSEQVRELVRQALNLCPGKPESSDETPPPISPKRESITEGGDDEDESDDFDSLEEGSTDLDGDESENDEGDDDLLSPSPDDEDPALNGADEDSPFENEEGGPRLGRKSKKVRGQNVSYRKSKTRPKAKDFFIPAALNKILENNTVQLSFSSDYQIPLESAVYLKTPRGNHYGIITASNRGAIQAKLLDPISPSSFILGGQVELGIVDSSQ